MFVVTLCCCLFCRSIPGSLSTQRSVYWHTLVLPGGSLWTVCQLGTYHNMESLSNIQRFVIPCVTYDFERKQNYMYQWHLVITHRRQNISYCVFLKLCKGVVLHTRLRGQLQVMIRNCVRLQMFIGCRWEGYGAQWIICKTKNWNVHQGGVCHCRVFLPAKIFKSWCRPMGMSSW